MTKRTNTSTRRTRKLLSGVLLCALLALCLLPCFLQSDAAGGFPSPDALYGIHNINLTYTFAPHVNNWARHTKESLLHDVGYYDRSGKLVDTFMDAYLFLPCVCQGPSGGSMYESSNPAKSSDWITYLDDLFADGYNVSALNAAVEEVGNQLGMPDYKVKVFFTVLFPHDGQTDFGSLDGTNMLDFSDQSDRAAAVDWLLAEEQKRFKEGNYTRLELAGFYWFEEFLTYTSENDVALVRHFNDKVHKAGCKSIWIPYYRARGYNHWTEFGFDVVCMQPNLMWMDSYDATRVSKCISDCRTYGMSMEMEMDNNALSSKYNFFLAYLRGGVSSGINRSINMYYQNSRYDVLYYAKNSNTEKGRSVYDLTYKYAKGILTLDEIPADEPGFKVPSGYEWIQKGKTYEASAAYTGDGTLIYQDVDGKELTDGIYAFSVWSTDFHAFHTSLQEPEGGYRITVDLGGLESRLGAFILELGSEVGSGISLPRKMTVSISEDGKSFREIGDMKLTDQSAICHAYLETDPVRARYVRVTMDTGTAPFVFCSEFLIGKKKTSGTLPKGDVNGDGEVSALDYFLIKRSVVGTYVLSVDERKRADVNGDGEVDVKDYVAVKKIVLGG